jgi:hypothetical protein
MTRPDRFVVGIEDEAERLIEYAIVPGVWNQNERLEEPRRVRAMPLGRAGIRHGLDRLVLSGEWSGDGLDQIPNIPVVYREAAASIRDSWHGLDRYRRVVNDCCSVLVAHTCLLPVHRTAAVPRA